MLYVLSEFLEIEKIIVPPTLEPLLYNPVPTRKYKKRQNGHSYRKFNRIPTESVRPGYSSESQYACRRCGKRYRWKSTMRRHEQVECGGKEPMFHCSYCPYKAKQKGNLSVHVRKHHPYPQVGSLSDPSLLSLTTSDETK